MGRPKSRGSFDAKATSEDVLRKSAELTSKSIDGAIERRKYDLENFDESAEDEFVEGDWKTRMNKRMNRDK